MNEQTIICPNCKTEFKLTESLVAPILESMRLKYESETAQKDAEYRKRESELIKDRNDIEEQVKQKLEAGRIKIVEEEEKKAKLMISIDLDQKEKELTELKEVLKNRDVKLEEAQKAQVELIHKQRELNDAKREIDLTVEKKVQESLSSVQLKYESEAAQKDADYRKREAELTTDRHGIEEKVRQKIEEGRIKIIEEEEKKARLMISIEFGQKEKELENLKEVLKTRDVKLDEAQKSQVELIHKQRELDDAKREIDLTVEKKVQESLSSVREQANKDADEINKFKLLEYQEKISSMQHKIEELKQKSEQGSQQLQGEVQELELEANLRSNFPQDIIEPVPKGEFGGDVLHRVVGQLGHICGTILWESKRTRNWSDNWLAKLRDDQRTAKAEVALIISQVLPKGIESFSLVDNSVWVCKPKYAIPLAVILRHSLIHISLARQAGEGQQTKMDLVYQYLTGPRFRQRIEAIVEKFTDMNNDLDRERKTITRQWAKREEQIRGVLDATSGMYGDIQGIAGKTLQEIEGLNINLIEDSTE